MKTLTALVLGCAMFLCQPAMAQDLGVSGGGTTNTEILIQKIKADKKLLVASNMDLNDAEGKKFWPLYEEYQNELMQINQRVSGDQELRRCLQRWQGGDR